jgi:hypothetical protein
MMDKKPALEEKLTDSQSKMAAPFEEYNGAIRYRFQSRSTGFWLKRRKPRGFVWTC